MSGRAQLGLSHSAAPASEHALDGELDPRRLAESLREYCEPRSARAIGELLLTAVPFFAFWSAALAGTQYSYVLSLLLAVPAAAFLVRLFMIQHDCSHGSFLGRRLANDMIGRVIGVFTLTPYTYWKRTHSAHHASSGDLGRRGIGDVGTLTVAEYLRMPRWRRVFYRIYRNPCVMLGIGPAYIFVLKHRLPFELMSEIKDGWLSVMTTNLAIAGLAAGTSVAVGFGNYVLIQLTVLLGAATIGVWLFYVQHQFHDTSWERTDDWSFHELALKGSSHYDLPLPLRWLTANIGIHHVHHLVSKIPSYRLSECLERYPVLRHVNRVTLWSGFKCATLALWDEEKRRLVAFREIKARRRIA